MQTQKAARWWKGEEEDNSIRGQRRSSRIRKELSGGSSRIGEALEITANAEYNDTTRKFDQIINRWEINGHW